MFFSNIVNLLTIISSQFYAKLYEPPNIQGNNLTIENADMTAVDKLIQILNDRLDNQSNLVENLTPILTCFIRLCKTERLIRKHVRMQVSCIIIINNVENKLQFLTFHEFL